MMGSTSWVHWAILLVVVILIFGTKKLGNMGSDIGKAVKGFKDGVKGGEEDKPAAPAAPGTIDIDAKEKK
jgi:sec-independent protein translocase protein TatA